MYKAKIEIGGYKVGDIVPDEQAILWIEMYKESPVEKVDGNAPASTPSKDDVEDESAKDESNAMHDDYLNRNGDVVLKNLKNDKFDKETLESLLDIESKGKKRKSVMEELKNKIEEL